MGRRMTTRVPVVREVKVWGTDVHGNPFMQTASTAEASQHGMRLRGLGCVQPDSLVTVEYAGQRARCHVVWIGALGSRYEGQVGLKRLAGEPIDFGAAIVQRPDEYSMSGPPQAGPIPTAPAHSKPDRRRQERRLHPRFTCAGSAEVRGEDIETSTRGRVSDISEGGCYVEMMSPYRIGSRVYAEVLIGDLRFHACAEVTVVHPGFGMGLRFIQLSTHDRHRLQEVLAVLASNGSAPQPTPPQAAAPAPAPAGPGAPAATETCPRLLDAVLRWFAIQDLLTRQQFLQLVQESRQQTAPAKEEVGT